MLSILSMDAYNHGYAEGIKCLGSQIGTASIFAQSEVADGSAGVAADFYALAYTIGAGVDGIAPGTTVISYRGTDDIQNEIAGR